MDHHDRRLFGGLMKAKCCCTPPRAWILLGIELAESPQRGLQAQQEAQLATVHGRPCERLGSTLHELPRVHELPKERICVISRSRDHVVRSYTAVLRTRTHRRATHRLLHTQIDAPEHAHAPSAFGVRSGPSPPLNMHTHARSSLMWRLNSRYSHGRQSRCTGGPPGSRSR